MNTHEAPVLHVAEPPPQFLMRPPLVVDCSVLSAVLFQEQARDAALELLGAKSLHAPRLLDYEIVSVALKKIRLGWNHESVACAMAEYATAALEFHDPDHAEVYALARRYELTAYDAAYLWLAAELHGPLATFEARLAAAARTHLAALGGAGT